MTPMADTFGALMLRELGALRRELEAYPDEASIWARPEGVPNAAGTLALHLAGNLRHFIGARLGGSGYLRDRAREFEARDVPLATLLHELGEAEAAVRQVMPTLTHELLAAPFPEVVGGQRMETADFLAHLCSHLGYHLGQVDYHRRVVTGQPASVGALPLAGLHSARPAAP